MIQSLINDLHQPVSVTGWWQAIIREPSQLGWVEHRCHDQLVSELWVVLVLVINSIFKAEYAVGNAGFGATFEQVVQTS